MATNKSSYVEPFQNSLRYFYDTYLVRFRNNFRISLEKDYPVFHGISASADLSSARKQWKSIEVPGPFRNLILEDLKFTPDHDIAEDGPQIAF